MGGFSDAIGNLAGLGTRLATKSSFPRLSRFSFDLYDETDRALSKMRSTESQGSRDAQAALAGIVSSLTEGKLPKEVEELVKRSVAEMGTTGGLGVSQTGARTARDLGLTALDMATRGAELTQMLQALELNRYNNARGTALDIANLKFKRQAVAMNHAYAKFSVKESRSQEYAASASEISSNLTQAFMTMGTPGLSPSQVGAINTSPGVV